MKLTQLVPEATQELEITSISWDTRKLTPGALFFAIPGFQTDGGLYIDQAFEKGAAAVVCAKSVERDDCIRVDDPRLALAQASKRWFDF